MDPEVATLIDSMSPSWLELASNLYILQLVKIAIHSFVSSSHHERLNFKSKVIFLEKKMSTDDVTQYCIYSICLKPWNKIWCEHRWAEWYNQWSVPVQPITNIFFNYFQAGKNWMFNNAKSPQHCELMTSHLRNRITADTAHFELRLHLIYLINDVLHHW